MVVKYGTRHSSAVRRSENESRYASRPRRRVDDERDVAAPERVDDVRAALLHLVDRLDRRGRALEERSAVPRRREQREAEPTSVARPAAIAGLVLVAHRDEDRARRRQAACRPRPAPSRRRAPKSASMPMTSPVDFISGPRIVSTPGNLMNGNTASLTRDVRAARSRAVKPMLGERLAGHALRGDLRERHADRLRHERHRARRARVHLEHVDVAVLHRELHVHQADDAELARERVVWRADLALTSRGERVRRQRARGVAGVDAGLLDVLHDAADDDARAVAHRVDVDLDRVLEEPVDQHRVLGRGARPRARM